MGPRRVLSLQIIFRFVYTKLSVLPLGSRLNSAGNTCLISASLTRAHTCAYDLSHNLNCAPPPPVRSRCVHGPCLSQQIPLGVGLHVGYDMSSLWADPSALVIILHTNRGPPLPFPFGGMADVRVGYCLPRFALLATRRGVGVSELSLVLVWPCACVPSPG